MNKIIIFILFSFSFSQEWHRISGDYYQIEFPAGFERIADSMATIAEYAIPRLSDIINYDVNGYKENPVKIYLTDAKDVSNGFAVENRVVIYATSSGYMDRWTGKANWYRRVLIHELAHNIMFRKVQRFPSIFGVGAQSTFDDTPRWFTEGLAQYYAEEWDFYRSDARLRTAVLRNQLSYGRMMADLGLAYSAGHAFVRYLSYHYGDKSLSDLMGYKADAFSFDFYLAFKDVYKKTVFELFAEFTQDMVIFYGSKYQNIDNNSDEFTKVISGRIQQFTPFNNDTSKFIFQTIADSKDNFISAYILSKNKTNFKTIQVATDDAQTNIVLSPDNKHIAYGTAAVQFKNDDIYSSYHWYFQNLATGNETEIASNIRVRSAVFLDNETLVLSEQSGNGTRLIRFNIRTKTEDILLETDISIGMMKANNQGQLYFLGQEDHQLRHIYKLEENEISILTDLEHDAAEFEITNTGDSLFYHVYEDEIQSLWFKNLENGESRRILAEQYDYQLQSITEDRKLLFKHNRFGNRIDIVSIPLDSIINQQVDLEFSDENDYGKWRYKLTEDASTLDEITVNPNANRKTEKDINAGMDLINGVTFLYPNFGENNSIQSVFTTVWFDPMQRHLITFNNVIDITNMEIEFLLFQHQLNKYGLSFTTSALITPAVFKFKAIEDLGLKRFFSQFEIAKNIYPGRNTRTLLTPSVYFTLNHSKITKNLDKTTIDKEASYTALGTKLNYKYELPSKLSPFLSKVRVALSADYFKTLSDDYDFSTTSINSDFEHFIFTERLTIQNKLNWVHQSGNKSPHDWVGIDHYYSFNSFKDIGISRSIRGYDNDMLATDFLWHSSELSFLLADDTGLKLLFVPLDNMTLNVFYEGAKIKSPITTTIYSIGTELLFGSTGFRYGFGYAKNTVSNANEENEKAYIRLNLQL